MLYIGEGGMTFEEKRRAAFEEFSRDRYQKAGISQGMTDFAHEWNGKVYTCTGTNEEYKVWQAALEWQNKGERE